MHQKKNYCVKTWFVLFVLLYVISCGKKKKEFVVPDGIIKKEEMVKVLADIHITEATINLRNVSSTNAASLNASLYKSVFVKHKISKEEFEKSYAFYSSNTELLNAVYDNVITELTKMQAEEEKKK